MSFIIKTIRRVDKRILTSATHLEEIPAFVGLNQFNELNFTGDEAPTKSDLTLKWVRVPGDDKLEGLLLLIGKIGAQPTIVFCNHRDAVSRISEQLSRLNVEHGVYHGGLEQIDREKTLIKFRNGTFNLLISTDLAARGLDIPEIKAVIHYQLPMTEDAMIHRNGRTARMNASGTGYFLLDATEYLPPFLETKPEEEKLPSKVVLPKGSLFKTLYISAGKKDKINKMDVVGMLLQKGGLQKDELGKVDILDYASYAAIKSDKIVKTIQLIKEERIKNKKVKFEISS